MTIHDTGQRSAAESMAAPTIDGWWGSTLNRPSRFVAKPEPVRAVWHDGSDARVAVVREWVQQVQQVAGGREVRVEVQPGAVVVVQQAWPAEPMRLRPGMFLVLNFAGWTVYSAEQFQAAFQPLPRELPIFNDGEVA